jgi:hypothetical protein
VTPLVTIDDEPTVRPPTVEPEERALESAADDEDVEEAVPEVVAPVPVTTTEPNVKLMNVIKSVFVVL